MTLAGLILVVLALTSAAHFGGIVVLMLRRRRTASRHIGRPPVTILRPLRGLENHIEATLASTFAIRYPRFEVIFCVADAEDPVVPLVRRLIAANPQANTRLMIGNDRISINPKLNNLVKGWHAARHDWIVMADSNVLIPADYIDRLLSAWTRDTGLVCSPPVGVLPAGAAADLECAFLNSHLARWELLGDLIGSGFALGKTMLWRREDLESVGGILALATGPAEDTSATKLIRAMGKRIRLVPEPFSQPLGYRRYGEVWRRQLRWARLQRSSFPAVYAIQGAAGGVIPMACAAALAAFGAFPVPAFVLFFASWYGAEVGLAWRYGWPISQRIVVFLVLRDLILPVLWAAGWVGSRFTWRGNTMDIAGVTGKDRVRRLVGEWRQASVLRLLTALGASRRHFRAGPAGQSRR
jgi:ceramide glucosyltransferase